MRSLRGSAWQPRHRSDSSSRVGNAIQAHGFLVRRSEDVDLFTTLGAPGSFAEGSMQLSLLTGQRSWK
jgi:hypothetical protein